MSKYTISQKVLIEDATCTASRYIDIAHDLLNAFWSKYFENTDDVQHLINELKCDPEAISNQLDAILFLMGDCKRELDVFNNPAALSCFFAMVDEMKVNANQE